MEFEDGKIYEVNLGSKHHYSRIKAKYVNDRVESCPDGHTVEMIEPIQWNGSIYTLALNKEFKQKYGHGIHFLVGRGQILKEIK